MKELILVFLLSSSTVFAQVLTPEEHKMLPDVLTSGDTNLLSRFAEKCTVNDNLYWDLQFFMAVALYEMKQYTQAIELLSIVKDAAPTLAIQCYQGIGMAKEKLGDVVGYKCALSMADKLSNAGTPLMRRSDYKGAIKYYSEFLAATPSCTNAIVFASLAYAQERLDQTNDALATCDRWVKAMPENAAAFRQRGGVKWKKGDKTGAKADFDTVKRLGGKLDAKSLTDESSAR